ncbi:MAG: preprotein translocase subunit SecE [Atopobiaceae bacterium]|jgi:preprotein translocase subunit SecE
MANKERNKRAARKARQQERAELESLHAASGAQSSVAETKGGKGKETTKAVAASKKSAKKKGFFSRISGYFKDVRSEMHQVVWPSKDELRNYSLAVIVMLIVFGVGIWLVDTGFVAGLVAFTGLRG